MDRFESLVVSSRSLFELRRGDGHIAFRHASAASGLGQTEGLADQREIFFVFVALWPAGDNVADFPAQWRNAWRRCFASSG